MDFQSIFQDWLVSFMEYLPRLISGIVIFIIALVVSGFLGKWVKNLLKKRISSQEVLHLIFLLTRWTIIIIGTVMALGQVNFDVTGFIAGLGIAGFTIGFALQDIAKNFISGLLLLYRQPFNLGDFVQVFEFSGTVTDINVRDTIIKTLDGELVIIPNQKVFENPIINFTDTRFRRRSITIGLGYDEDAEQAIDIFMSAIKSVPGVESDPAPAIRALELGDSTLTLSANFWVDQKENDLVGVHSEVVKAIKVASETHRIDLPYPIQTVFVQQIDG